MKLKNNLSVWSAALSLAVLVLEASACWAQMTLEQTSAAVQRAWNPNTPPAEKAALLPQFYDIIKSDPTGPDGDNKRQQAVEGTHAVWSDPAVDDQLLENTLKQYFSSNRANFTKTLGFHFQDEVKFYGRRPARYDNIVAAVVQESIVNSLLLESPDLNPDSPVAKDAGLNDAFNNAIAFLDTVVNPFPGGYDNSPGRLNYTGRKRLFDSTTDLIKALPYLQRREGTETDQKVMSCQDRVADIIALHYARVFDLNPFSNYQQITDRKRAELKQRIADTYSLRGLDRKTWDRFSVLVNPYYKDSLRYYYNLCEAYPSMPILQPTSRVVYRFGDWDSPGGKAFQLFSTGTMEFGIHGIGHNIFFYILRNSRDGKTRIGNERLEEIATGMKKRGWNHLPAQCMGYYDCGKYWGWWGVSTELWATLVNVYMVDSDFAFATALAGPTQRLDQFLFVLDIFSLESNVGRFYRFGSYELYPRTNKSYWFGQINKPFTVTDVPLTRNDKGWITSLTLRGEKYTFDLDDRGNVTRYTVSHGRR